MEVRELHEGSMGPRKGREAAYLFNINKFSRNRTAPLATRALVREHNRVQVVIRKVSVETQQCIRKSVPKRDVTAVLSVGKAITTTRTSDGIRKNTQERDPMYAPTVERALTADRHSADMKGSTKRRKTTVALTVGKNSESTCTLLPIRQSTQEREPISVLTVTKASD